MHPPRNQLDNRASKNLNQGKRGRRDAEEMYESQARLEDVLIACMYRKKGELKAEQSEGKTQLFCSNRTTIRKNPYFQSSVFFLSFSRKKNVFSPIHKQIGISENFALNTADTAAATTVTWHVYYTNWQTKIYKSSTSRNHFREELNNWRPAPGPPKPTCPSLLLPLSSLCS